MLALCFFAWGAFCAGDAQAAPDSPTFEDELKAKLPDFAPEISALVERLREREIPLTPLRKKLHEGLTKRIDAVRIKQALLRMADDLLWLDEQLARCFKSLSKDKGVALYELGDEVLWSGVERTALAPALAEVCKQKDPSAALAAAAELHFFLTTTLDAPAPQSWAFVAEILRRGAQGAANRVVLVLQEIHRQRGSIVPALERAQKRLRAGASLRAIRNELQDQFLPR